MEGPGVGSSVGSLLGAIDGKEVGKAVGTGSEGLGAKLSVGKIDGFADIVGNGVKVVGLRVGDFEGTEVGETDGESVITMGGSTLVSMLINPLTVSESIHSVKASCPSSSCVSRFLKTRKVASKVEKPLLALKRGAL